VDPLKEKTKQGTKGYTQAPTDINKKKGEEKKKLRMARESWDVEKKKTPEANICRGGMPKKGRKVLLGLKAEEKSNRRGVLGNIGSAPPKERGEARALGKRDIATGGQTYCGN